MKKYLLSLHAQNSFYEWILSRGWIFQWFFVFVCIPLLMLTILSGFGGCLYLLYHVMGIL